MTQLIKYFIKYPVNANILVFLLLIFGYFGLNNLNSTFFPEFDQRRIQVQIVYPGASPEEIEEGVVQKIEENLKGTIGVERTTSISTENAATITVEVLREFNTDEVLEEVKNAVSRIPSFPTDMEPPVIFKIQNISDAYSFALLGREDTPLKTLKEYAEKVEDELTFVDGISQVTLEGFPPEEIEVRLREKDLQKYKLSFDQVATAVRNGNLRITGGTIKTDNEELLIRANAKDYFAPGFDDIVVKANPNGELVYLSDVADVVDQWNDSPERVYLNGKPAVIINVDKTPEEDIIYITDYVRNYIDAFNQKHEIISAVTVSDRSDNLNKRISLLQKNGLIGGLFVLLVLALFLNLRLAFWVAIAIPVSFMGMFIFASIFGITINVISLFGMILVIGILVDDGIVIAENIYQKYEEGLPPFKAAVQGTLEVLPSVTAAIFTTVAAFMMFFFLDGRMGDFMREMAFVVIFTLLVSLVEGALILPAHLAHSKALSQEDKTPKYQQVMSGFMIWLRDKIFAPFINFSLRNRVFSLSIAFGLLLVTLGAISGGIIQTTFFPFIDRDRIDITLEMPSGTRETETYKWLTHIEQAAVEINEEIKTEREDSKYVIDNIIKKVEAQPHKGSIRLLLLEGEERNMRSFDITQRIRERAGEIKEAEKLSYGISSNFGKPVEVSLRGENLDALRAAKNELSDELNKLSSLKDIIDTDEEGLREIKIKLKEKAYLLGLSYNDVVRQIRQGFFGQEVQRLQRGNDEVKVWVRYHPEERSSEANLEDMRIRLADGSEYPLQEVAIFEKERGIVAINHLEGKREIKVMADLADQEEPVPPILEEIENNILPQILERYPSVFASFEGQHRENQKTTTSMRNVGIPVLIIMIFIVLLSFRSFWQTLVVYLMVPFGMIGIGWGHFLHDKPISIMSMFGIIALIGIMVNDSLVYIGAMNQYLKEGKTFFQAVVETSKSRFRPIILTSVTTIAGLAPLILERSLQAQFLIPMAISISYGLMVATFTTLVLLPIFLILVNFLKRYLYWAWHGNMPSPEDVEPAIKELKAEKERQNDL